MKRLFFPLVALTILVTPEPGCRADNSAIDPLIKLLENVS